MLSEAFTSIEGNPFFYFFTKGTYDFFSIGIRNTMYEGMCIGISKNTFADCPKKFMEDFLMQYIVDCVEGSTKNFLETTT